jgi:mono/diheme cytochrome c family protein
MKPYLRQCVTPDPGGATWWGIEEFAMPIMSRFRRTVRGAGSGLCLAALAVGTVFAPAGGALAQDFQDKGFYQSYVFGTPDEPSEAWLLAYGGRLYDMWWAVLFADPPQQTHPAYPKQGSMSGSETWRCVECHGWDYRGKDGAYAVGPHRTGIKGISAMAGADPNRIAAIVRGPKHGYTVDMIPDAALNALALFVSKGQVNDDKVIDQATGRVHGDPARGKPIFQNVCAICHDYDGMAWITGDDDDLQTLGAIANANPWRGLHKVMNGQTYADMPAMRAFDLQTVLDILAYAQTLPQRQQ